MRALLVSFAFRVHESHIMEGFVFVLQGLPPTPIDQLLLPIRQGREARRRASGSQVQYDSPRGESGH